MQARSVIFFVCKKSASSYIESICIFFILKLQDGTGYSKFNESTLFFTIFLTINLNNFTLTFHIRYFSIEENFNDKFYVSQSFNLCNYQYNLSRKWTTPKIYKIWVQ